jgi:hypothetical protein
MSHDPSSSPQGSPRSSISASSPEHAQMLQMQQQMAAMYAQMQQQQQQLQQQAAAAHAVSSSSSLSSSAPRAPEPPKIRQPLSFAGSMGSGVDDFIGEMQQQFAYYGARFPDDAAKIRFAVAYLTGAAMHWWEHQSPCTVWNDFVSRLHGRFRPVHAAMLARQKLGKLRQRPGQSVNQYISIFQNTLTPISDMGDMDQVHHFVNGLLGPIAAKVWEKHPQDLVQAIDAAVSVEAMHNFGRAALPHGGHGYGNRSSSASSSANPDAMDINNVEAASDDTDESAEEAGTHALMSKMVNQMSAMELRLNALTGNGGARGGAGGGRPPRDRIAGLDAATIKKLQAEGKCFRCKEKGHMKNECPKKPKNA